MTRQKKKTSNVAVIVAISVVAAAAVAFGVWKVTRMTRMKCKPLIGMTDQWSAAKIQKMCNNRESEENCKATTVQGTGNVKPVQACQWGRA